GIDFSISYNVQPAISSKRIATFICPSDPSDRGSGTDPVYGNKHWTLHYAVNLGTWAVLRGKTSGMQGGDGAFSPNYGFGPPHFTDGMSNTIGLAEVKGYTTRVSGTPTSVAYPVLMPPPTSPGALTASPPFGLSGLSLA